MPVTEEIIAANADYVTGFTKGDLPLPPARKVAIVSCMDARLIPSRALGLDDVDFLRESPLPLEGVSVRGFVYDVHTGRITEVKVPSAATVT